MKEWTLSRIPSGFKHKGANAWSRKFSPNYFGISPSGIFLHFLQVSISSLGVKKSQVLKQYEYLAISQSLQFTTRDKIWLVKDIENSRFGLLNKDNLRFGNSRFGLHLSNKINILHLSKSWKFEIWPAKHWKFKIWPAKYWNFFISKFPNIENL